MVSLRTILEKIAGGNTAGAPNYHEETSFKLGGNFDDPAAKVLEEAFFGALALDTKLPDWIVRMEGMSGKKYRYLINNLISATPGARYLEIGSWAGSTACAAIYGNELKIQCIDNWSEFGGPKEQFFENTDRCRTGEIDFNFTESDFRTVDYSALGPFNVYLFDGPHTEIDQYDGVVCAQPCLESTFTMIVDDWNWERVRIGTTRALKDLKIEVVARIEVRTTQDDSYPTLERQHSDWHNGYFIAVCRKSAEMSGVSNEAA